MSSVPSIPPRPTNRRIVSASKVASAEPPAPSIPQRPKRSNSRSSQGHISPADLVGVDIAEPVSEVPEKVPEVAELQDAQEPEIPERPVSRTASIRTPVDTRSLNSSTYSSPTKEKFSPSSPLKLSDISPLNPTPKSSSSGSSIPTVPSRPLRLPAKESDSAEFDFEAKGSLQDSPELVNKSSPGDAPVVPVRPLKYSSKESSQEPEIPERPKRTDVAAPEVAAEAGQQPLDAQDLPAALETADAAGTGEPSDSPPEFASAHASESPAVPQRPHGSLHSEDSIGEPVVPERPVKAAAAKADESFVSETAPSSVGADDSKTLANEEPVTSEKAADVTETTPAIPARPLKSHTAEQPQVPERPFSPIVPVRPVRTHKDVAKDVPKDLASGSTEQGSEETPSGTLDEVSGGLSQGTGLEVGGSGLSSAELGDASEKVVGEPIAEADAVVESLGATPEAAGARPLEPVEEAEKDTAEPLASTSEPVKAGATAESPQVESKEESAALPKVAESPSLREEARETASKSPEAAGKAKPIVPARPSKFKNFNPFAQEQAEQAAAKKTPPTVPNKISMLRNSLFKDLDNVMARGPLPPGAYAAKSEPSKREEDSSKDVAEVEQKIAPLPSKPGRARGPQRRPPAAAKVEWSVAVTPLWDIYIEADKPAPMVGDEADKPSEASATGSAQATESSAEPEKDVPSAGPAESAPATELSEPESLSAGHETAAAEPAVDGSKEALEAGEPAVTALEDAAEPQGDNLQASTNEHEEFIDAKEDL